MLRFKLALGIRQIINPACSTSPIGTFDIQDKQQGEQQGGVYGERTGALMTEVVRVWGRRP